MKHSERGRRILSIKEIAVFSMLGTVMFLGDILFEMLPNVHFVGVLTAVYTMVYRKKALIPIYIYILLNGIYAGFSLWWIPYLYIWIPLWGMVMLIPRGLHVAWTAVLCSAACAFHGIAFGTLYAPAQAIMFGLKFDAMIAWIIAGLPFDMIHGAGNFVGSVIVIPLMTLLCKLEHLPLPYRTQKKRNCQ